MLSRIRKTSPACARRVASLVKSAAFVIGAALAATGCAGGPLPAPTTASAVRALPVAAACQGRSLEYSVGRTVLQPDRLVRLSCEGGRPTALFFTATPHAMGDDGEEIEAERAGPEEVMLDREIWRRTWRALERAGADGVVDCGPRANDGSGVAHRLAIVNAGAETVAWCHGAVTPEAWRAAVEILERLEGEYLPQTGEELHWPFGEDYWQGELSYSSR